VSYVPLASKLIGETITLEYDFQSEMRFGETLDPPYVASVTVTVFSGVDPDPSMILTGPVTVVGTSVFTDVTAGLGGVIYTIAFHAAGSSGAVYRAVRRMAVLTDAGSYVTSSVPTLTGTLPDGIVGAPYSAALQISGGYAPYTPVGLIVGAPAWMGFTVVGDELICAGTPDEPAGTSYSFSPQILDSALTPATSPQDINITRIVTSGDLLGGVVGDTGTYQYTSVGGTAPYTYSIIAGALPDGASMDSAGLVTYTYTTPGSFSWTVLGTDANGVTSPLPDTADVIYAQWIVFDSVIGMRRGLLGGVTWDVPSQSIPVSGFAIADPALPNRTYRHSEKVLVTHCFAAGGGPGTILSSDAFVTVSGQVFGSEFRQPTAAYVDGKWFVSDTVAAGIYRQDAPSTWTLLPSALGSNPAIGGDDSNLYKFASGDGFRRISTVDASVLQFYAELAFGRVTMAGHESTTVALHHRYAHDLTSSFYVFASGVLVMATSPFPATLTSDFGFGVYYLTALGKWVAVLQNRLAYATSPTSWTLSSYVFPDTIVGVDAAGGKALVVCNGGTIHHTVDLINFTTIFNSATATNPMTNPVGIAAVSI
jgi:hypothetical protein